MPIANYVHAKFWGRFALLQLMCVSKQSLTKLTVSLLFFNKQEFFVVDLTKICRIPLPTRKASQLANWFVNSLKLWNFNCVKSDV